MQTKIGVVVLNYKNYKVTIKCLDSLIIQKDVDLHIIIVDNGSGNESVEVLYNKYCKFSCVHFINLEKNLGFARGNNAGIKFAREKLFCDFVMILNSDTILTDDSIVAAIKTSYTKGAGVLNCKCITEDNQELLPYSFSDNIYIRFIVRILRDILRYYSKQKVMISTKKGSNIGKYSIQGCAYVLTPDFFKYYSQLYPGTFLYNEEDVLALYLKKGKLYSKSMCSAPIIHKRHQSTSKNILERRQHEKIALKNDLKIAGLVFMPRRLIIKKYS